MFSYCSNLTNIDLSNFDTKNAIDMRKMFYNCSNLANIDLSRFDFAKVERMDDIFYGGDSSDNFVR